jgi:methyl-accepting chemotaxis protein
MAVSQMDKVTQSNAAAAEENAASAATLNSQSNRLLDAVSSLHGVIEGEAPASQPPTAAALHSHKRFQSAAKKQLPGNRDFASAGFGSSAPAKDSQSLKQKTTASVGEFQNF